MKTEALIDLLARQAGPARPQPVARRLLPAWAGGGMLAAVLALGLSGPLPLAAFASPTPWIKLLPAALLAALGWLWLRQTARPASPTRPARRRLESAWLLLALLGVGSLWLLPAGARMSALLGSSWWQCPLTLATLALPALLLLLRAAQGLPIIRPRQAGAALGLLAGCTAAAAYALSCPESSPAFVALWYSAGLLLSMAAGAALGARRLRW
ncbi:MAG: NrsF family protein [Roseateles asaccharophilus]|uniref:DUF1109 domain-containing protein n=1 Tax=Roseateles asaccharophilus TaxID=582607 RepID=A0A4R6N318_9BURK|nr:NrsF family protein [Roseateles asaccharophilus]TDP09224.1 hypothetical protein DFR39_10560 [Roseateles asaccharophilus]